ncbi:MAG: hypothetical protein NC453_18210 [Muribaculum sp.]|nr:hypothetical protein [Muribaculum sp.]
MLCFTAITTITASSEQLTADSLANRLMYQVWSYPQEKVYVMTDRDAYISGDTVRFRAWLVDAATHAHPQQPSRFVYVELRNPFGEVAKRVKIRDEKGKFAGIIALDDELAEGSYTLCAYTQFMQNSGKDYFFRKTVPVFSQLSNKYRIETNFENGYLTSRLLEKITGIEVRAEKISIQGPDSTFFVNGVRKRSSYSLALTPKLRKAGMAKVKFDKYEKFVAIPYDTTSISLTFHPEGGYLIPDELNRLAFKAIDNRGLSSDFKGIIVDDLGGEVSSIESTHRGMGVIDFVPRSERTYKAIVDTMSFPIPSVEKSAAILRLSPMGRDRVKVEIRGKYKAGLSLIVHNGGIVSHSIDMTEPSVILNRAHLGSGIVQFLLVDSSGETLSSRMIFNHLGYIYNASVDSLPEGDYAIRAFRNASSDSTLSIVSNLLLQSELKGHIEDPDYYFRNRDSVSDFHLDLLMLTQGWERYDIKSSIKGDFSEAEIPIEIGGEITGTVKSRWRGRPLEGAVVMVLVPKMEYAAQTITDKNGRFVIDGFDWPEDTSFIIRVLNDSGDKEHNYTVDDDKFPTIDPLLSKEDRTLKNNTINERLLSLGAVMLDELEVTAPMSLEESRREMLSALGVRTFTSDDIDAMHATTYEEIFRKIPGLRIVNGNVVSVGSKSAYNMGTGGSLVEFWVDGSQWSPSFPTSSGSLSMKHATASNAIGGEMIPEHSLTSTAFNMLSEFSGMYPFHIMKSIEYFRPSAAMIISISAAYAGGALVFTTKDASDIKEWDANLFIKEFTPMGFQNQSDAYQPHYIYEPTNDYTVYNAAWLPYLTEFNEFNYQENVSIQLEGIANGFIPVIIRLNTLK